MRTEGICEQCKTKGDWEVGIIDTLAAARNRPEDWAVMVMLRNGKPVDVPPRWRRENWSSPEFCRLHNTDVGLYCPNCLR